MVDDADRCSPARHKQCPSAEGVASRFDEDSDDAASVTKGEAPHHPRWRTAKLAELGRRESARRAAGYPVLACEIDGVLAGFASFGEFRARSGYRHVVEHSIYVATDHRRRGIARVLLGAYLFGGVTMMQLQLQGEGVQISSQFLTMLPYLATILVLVLISRNAAFIRVNMPASIGKPFFPG